jgi:hypothetical protein
MEENRQQGFGAALVLVVVATIVVAGLIGWNVYSNKKSSVSNPAQTSGQTSMNPATTNPQTTQPAQVDANAEYVVIKEWGVRFKTVDGLKDVVYAVDPSFHSGNLEYIKFSTKALAQFGVSCSEKGIAPLGGLMRSKIRQDFDQAFPGHPQMIDDYYYEYSGAQSACSDIGASNEKVVDDLQTKTNSLFRPSIKTLEAAK